jgi:hypothetical protein
MRAWAPSRAVEDRMSSVVFEEGGRGFRSSARRFPRSNVYGMGFSTAAGL